MEKKILAVSAIVIMLLVGGFLTFMFVKISDQKNENISNPNRPLLVEDYYENLKNKCNGNSCCISSVDSMKSASAKLAENETCPDGSEKDMLKCEGTYIWCKTSTVSGNENNHQANN